MKELKIYYEDHRCMPKRMHPTDAGMDLRAAEAVIIKHSEVTLVGCGIQVEIPPGYVGYVHIRSSLAKKGITLVNSVGVIDSDYRGEIICMLTFDARTGCKGTYRINQYDRIAQLIISSIELPTPIYAATLTSTKRSEGGFGSTGNG